MQKELNPDLFGESSASKTRVVEGAEASGLSHSQMLQVDHKLADMRHQVNALIERTNRMVGQMNEFITTSHARFEKLQSAILQLEKNDQALSLDNGRKLSAMHAQLGERKTLDLKMQEMIDRHNNVLKSYELRLAQLQKLISEREDQILRTTAALNEAKMEISRMKRL